MSENEGTLWVPLDVATSRSVEYEALLDAARDLDVDVKVYERFDDDDGGFLIAAMACGFSGALVASIIWAVCLAVFG